MGVFKGCTLFDYLREHEDEVDPKWHKEELVRVQRDPCLQHARTAMEADEAKQDRLARAEERRRKIVGDVAAISYKNDQKEKHLQRLDKEIHVNAMSCTFVIFDVKKSLS